MGHAALLVTIRHVTWNVARPGGRDEAAPTAWLPGALLRYARDVERRADRLRRSVA